LATEKRDLDYYVDHPSELPQDFAQIAGFEEGEGEESGGTVSEAIGEEKGASTQPDAKTESDAGKKEGTAESKGDATAATEGEAPKVVLSKDGQHAIPYGVLESERAARKAAEDAAKRFEEQLAALKAAQATGTVKEQAQAQAKVDESVGDLSPEDLEALESDFPAVAKAIKGMNAAMVKQAERIEHMQRAEIARGQREQATASTSVQEAIDKNPTLSYWQQKDAEAFERAKAFDNQFRQDPKLRGLSLDERFAKVVTAIESVYGPTELPDGFKPAAPAAKPTSTATTTAKPAAKKDVEAEAAKAVKEAEAKGATVQTLSDIPGGVPPESEEITQMGQLSAHELGNKFMNMSPLEIGRILQRLPA
jgi:hypothetical protein